MSLSTRSLRVIPIVLAAACGGTILDDGEGGLSSTSRSDSVEEGLSGCRGQAASSVPADGVYVLTSFGFSPSDDGTMSCGQKTRTGSWYYAASRQRYGCGARVKIEANGRCVVAETDDYGPDVCVERAAGKPIMDASPLVSMHLFGTRSAGWSDNFRVRVTEVSRSTALGPCGSTTTPPPTPPPSGGGAGAAECSSSTLARKVPSGTCVQSAGDGAWYRCSDGTWVAGATSCTTRYAWCQSDTLGRAVPPRTCVESRFDNTWYQCTQSGWAKPVSDGAGPLGTCSAEYAR